MTICGTAGKEQPCFYSWNLQLLATEMHKASKDLPPQIIAELFKKSNEHQYNLRHNSEFVIPALKSVYHETESRSILGPKIWNISSDRLKKIDSLKAFKTAIKSWKCQKCPWRLCRKIYSQCQFYQRKPEFFQMGKALIGETFVLYFSLKNGVNIWITLKQEICTTWNFRGILISAQILYFIAF